MISKQIDFPGVDETTGRIFTEVYNPGESMLKLAGAKDYDPQLSKYLATLQKSPSKIYVVVTALGAGEYYGSNVNGDFFEEKELLNPDPKHGYITFQGAGVYRHHCFPAGTEVLLADRRRVPIEDVEAGEEVLTLEGAKQVTDTFRRAYKGTGIRMALRGRLDPFVATENHPVLVYRREQVHCRHRYSKLGQKCSCREVKESLGEPTWVPAGTVLPGDYLVFPAPRHGEVKVAPEFARLVGWVASEGCLGRRGSIQFTFSETNEEDILNVTACLEENGLHVGVLPLPQRGTVMLSACSKKLHAKLSQYITGTLSSKTLTSKVLTWDARSLEQLLGTYIDGDGHVAAAGKNKGQLRIRSSSRQMLHVLGDIVRSLEIPCALNWDAPPHEMAQLLPEYGPYWSSGSGCVAVSAFYSAKLCKLSRKVEIYQGREPSPEIYDGAYLVRVTDTECIDLDEEVFNLEIEGPQHYVANEVIVHNCNKDKRKSFGKVVLALYHRRMHRVELVIEIDKTQARGFGHDSLIDMLERGENPPVSMGCFKAGTPITLADGSILPIEEIVCGMEVLTHMGERKAVTDTMVHTHRGAFSVKVDGCPTLEVTEEHPFWTLQKEALVCVGNPQRAGRKVKSICSQEVNNLRAMCTECSNTCAAPEFAWKRTDELSAGDYVAFPVPAGEDTTLTLDQMRFLGYYAAEGHILWDRDKLPCGVEFSIGVGDEYIIDELTELAARLGTRNPVGYRKRTNGEAYAVYVYSQGLAHLCHTHAGFYARQKRLSPEVMYAPVEAQAAFLGAYANGDGGAYKGALYYSTANRALAEQLFWLLARCEMKASINVNHHKPNALVSRATVEYQVWVGTDTSWKLGPLTSKKVHAGAALNTRRFFLTSAGVKYLVSRVTHIEYEPDWEGPVYNFSVGDDESYVAGRTAVHNCRVKFDVCCICGHKSKTRADYCHCAKNYLGKILPNGKKVYVTNPNMTFFDISFVLVGADKVSFVMEKVAEYAMAKDAQDKLSTIVKEIPDLAHHLDPLFKREDTLPQGVMDGMGGLSLDKALSALLGKGIVLKPVEFQYMLLKRKPSGFSAADLLRRNIVFTPSGAPAGMNLLKDAFLDYPLGLPPQILARRSFSSPLLSIRLTKLLHAQPPDEETPLQAPISKLLSSMYLDYRRNVLEKLPSLVVRFPLEKTAAVGPSALWISMLPVMYLLSAHLRSKERQHLPLSDVEHFILRHPIMLAAAVAGAGLGLQSLKNLLV